MKLRFLSSIYSLTFPLYFLLCPLIKAEDLQLAQIFKKYGIEGTMVLSDLEGKNTFIHNDERANSRLCPASTFKIPNTLIALEEKVARDKSTKFIWNHKKYKIETWNQNQTLESAYKRSCLWVYQKVARSVGVGKYKEYLNLLNYGNQKVGDKLEHFWLLGGDLKISPKEQTEFLKNIYQKKYHLREATYEQLRAIMLEDENSNGLKFYAKTGTCTKNWVGHGWYVGYIEYQSKVWFFATNIFVKNYNELELRKKITMEAFQEKVVRL